MKGSAEGKLSTEIQQGSNLDGKCVYSLWAPAMPLGCQANTIPRPKMPYPQRWSTVQKHIHADSDLKNLSSLSLIHEHGKAHIAQPVTPKPVRTISWYPLVLPQHYSAVLAHKSIRQSEIQSLHSTYSY